MEKAMTRSIVWSAALLFAVLLMSSAYAVAGASGPLAIGSAGASAHRNAVNLAVHPAQIPATLTGVLYNGWWDGYQYDKYKDKDHKHDHHEPTPEPSTLLSFGVALLIGGAVLYSRRLRRNRK